MNMPDTHPDDLSQAESLTIVKKIIEKSARPLNTKEIHKDIPGLYQLKEQALARLLQQEAAAGSFHRWPGKPGSPKERFWHQDEISYFQTRIVTALSRSDLTKNELMKRLTKNAIPCFKNRLDFIVNTILQTLIKEKTAFEIPPWGRKRNSRYAAHPPDISVYINKVRKEFDETSNKLKKFGIGAEQLFLAFKSSLSLPAGSISEAAIEVPAHADTSAPEISEGVLHRIIQTMLHIEPSAAQQAPVWIPELRLAMGLSKNTFDRAVLMLSKQGKVFLNRHAHPAQMDDAAKETMIPDGHGNYFVVVGLREGFRG
jgi:hypothetical protein